MSDLRTFLDAVREHLPREIVDVRRSVSPRYETTAILTRLEAAHRSPILVFHDVAGSRHAVVSNVCGSMRRLALALDCPVADLSRRYAEGCRRLVEPAVVTGAPVQEQVRRGAEVDLGGLPQMVYHENDATRPYITAAIVVARDPESRKANLSYHRLMITGRATTGIFIAPGKHLDAIHRKYAAAGADMPIAVFIGAHPAWSLGALYTGPAGVEEYGVIGGLQGAPLEVTECVSKEGLFVPARAEIVLEGSVAARERTDEGPFGEFTGYSTGTMHTPVFHVDAITMRGDALYQDITGGHTEHLTLPLLGIEHDLLEAARSVVPGVTQAKALVPLTAVVAIAKTDDGQPRRLIEALIDRDVYNKHVIVVDDGVNLSDPRHVLRAMALHVQADRDVFIYPGKKGTPLDPSAHDDGRTAKMGIDATAPLVAARAVRHNAVPQALLDAIDLSEILDGPIPRA